jgi:thiol-disulfide isomerase/thioredoxin
MSPQVPPSGRGSSLDPGRVIAAFVLLGCCGLVVALFLWMVPSAAAREVTAACNGMRPSWTSAKFRKLPAEAPDFALTVIGDDTRRAITELDRAYDARPAGDDPDRLAAWQRELEARRAQIPQTLTRTVRLSDFRGKVVLVNFWASWCDVCKAEKKSLARLSRELGDDGLVVLSIASDTELELIDDAMRLSLNPDATNDLVDGKRLRGPALGGAPFQILLDPPDDETLGEVAHAWGLEKVPESFLVDKDGRVRMYIVNKRDWSAGVVETCVRSFLDE